MDSRIESPFAVRPTIDAHRRICGKGQMALYEDESCGLARVTSDDRILPWLWDRHQAPQRRRMLARGRSLTYHAEVR